MRTSGSYLDTYMVSNLDVVHHAPTSDHHAGSFMPADQRKLRR